ncbi:MAG: DUF5309 family protein [Gemmatimonadota bacterium]
MASIGQRDVGTLFVELLTDTLRARAHNAKVEGQAATNPTLTQPVRHFVHVQSFAEWGVVSDEQRIVDHINEDPYVYQIRKSLEQLMNDVEHTLHRGSANTGTSDIADVRQFAGLINIFSNQTGIATYTSSSGTTFTEEVLVDLLQVFRDQSLDVSPTQAYVNSFLKRTISEFSTRVTRNVDAADAMQKLMIERHTSDFGDLDILYTEDQLIAASKTTEGNSICFLDPSLFKIGWARRPMVEALSRDGLRDRYQMNAQATLLFQNEKGGGGGEGFVSYINQA